MIAVKNESKERRKLSLGFDLRAGVTHKEGFSPTKVRKVPQKWPSR